MKNAILKGNKFAPREYKETTSVKLNEALDFDPYTLVADGTCPPNWEIMQTKLWLNSWISLFQNTDLLEQDLEILRNVRALIFSTRQNIMVAGTMPLEFAENMKKLRHKKANYIQVIYGAEMAAVFSNVSQMEASKDLNETLGMCDNLLHDIDELLTDLSAVFGYKSQYAEFIQILKALDGVLDQIKEDCDEVAGDDSLSEEDEWEEIVEYDEDGNVIVHYDEDGNVIVKRQKKARRAYKPKERDMSDIEDQLFEEYVDEKTGEVKRRRRPRGEIVEEITDKAKKVKQSDGGGKFDGDD